MAFRPVIVFEYLCSRIKFDAHEIALLGCGDDLARIIHEAAALSCPTAMHW